MRSVAAEISEKLAQMVETVCAHYLSNGSKDGAYWRVGDAQNTPGRSVTGSAKLTQSAPRI